MTLPLNGVALEAAAISKAFPGVQALDDVSMSLKGGEIHALVGENGAGKSTLIKIVTGLYRQDSGTLRMGGEEVEFDDPRHSIEAGIAVVPQERNLIPEFSVGENILIERMPLRGSIFVDYDTINREAARWLEVMNLDIPVTRRAARLSAAEGQLVEIARRAGAGEPGAAARRAHRVDHPARGRAPLRDPALAP